MAKRLSLTAALLVVALAAGHLLIGHESGTRDAPAAPRSIGPGGQASVDDAAESAVESADAPVARPPVPGLQARAPLPPHDAPVASYIDELQQRAEAGDARAACRLAVEIEECRQASFRLNGAQHFLELAQKSVAAADKTKPGRQAEAERRRQFAFAMKQAEAALAVAERCTDVPPFTADDRLKWLRRAALAGHVPSMRNYATGKAFSMGNVLDNLAALETFRREAGNMAWRAAAAGDGAMHLELMQTLSGSEFTSHRSLLGQVLGIDKAKAYALLLRLHEQWVGDDVDRSAQQAYRQHLDDLEASLTAAERARVDQLTNAWARAWQPLRSSALDARREVTPSQMQREECDSDHFYDGAQP